MDPLGVPSAEAMVTVGRCDILHAVWQSSKMVVDRFNDVLWTILLECGSFRVGWERALKLARSGQYVLPKSAKVSPGKRNVL